MSETPQNRGLETAIVADRLALVALTLFAVYGAAVLASILPPRLLDPLWQLSSTRITVEAAPIPLLGLALLHLAAYLSPANLRLQRRREALARLAVPVSLAFLLIVPLQGQAVWRSYQLANAVAGQQQASTSERADRVRLAIEQATSPADLQRRLLALQRPDLRIQLDPSRFPTIPLPVLKRQLLSQLDQAEGEVKARFAPVDPATADRITRESLRVIVSSIAFAAGFAACAQRKGQQVPFLVEWPFLLAQLNPLELWRRARTARGNGGLALRRSAAEREAEFFESLAPPEDGGQHPAA
ncbi:hypothetical protein KBY84_00560 [Cyanobium sp. N.Huapi 1H5]|uniref:hypothetical protein n=1 Tax=Cyanobium sp. N.Huapi 1H5 TaxID=2823719 RepID=UPI0020CC82AF|nr:hypothetical protein [Cyanobium sp. N.Huapi 1H5]MCP9835978.1 hypothetical protein [Cyanobium sp. N.Huapi 1H5]